ncbi:MAG: hypothetical protein V1709_03005 [Planctomycetota bacterium]
MNEEMVEGLRAQIEGLKGQVEGLKAQLENYRVMEMMIPPRMRGRMIPVGINRTIPTE